MMEVEKESIFLLKTYSKYYFSFLLKSTKKSFTLLELSIVILVMSLLVSIGLKAIAIKDAGSIQTLMENIVPAQKAIGQFEEIYFKMPGDFTDINAFSGNISGSLATNNIFAGDGNGMVDATLIGSSVNYSCSIQTWRHLWAAKLINTAFTGICAGTQPSKINCSKPGTNIPLLPSLNDANIGMSIVALLGTETLVPSYISTYAKSINSKFGILVSSFATQSQIKNFGYSPAVSPNLLQKIDLKFDNGAPKTGIIIAAEAKDSTGTDLVNKCIDSTGKYIKSDSTTCMFYFLF